MSPCKYCGAGHCEHLACKSIAEARLSERRAVLLRVAGECREEADSIDRCADQLRRERATGATMAFVELGAKSAALRLMATKYEREAAEVK